MYGTDAPTVRKLAIRILSQTSSSSACERNWSTFALIHTKQRNRLSYSRLEKMVYCYYNMKLHLRDQEAEEDRVDQYDPLDMFETLTASDDVEGDQLYQWIRPSHLDDDEGNPAPAIAAEARNEGINVERVVDEEVSPTRTESFENLMQGPARNRATNRSNPSEEYNSTTNSDTPTNSGSIGGGGGSGGGYGDYPRDPQEYMSPFTGEADYMHTQDQDHGSRRAGPGIGAIGKNYSRRKRGDISLIPEDEESLSTTFGSMGVGDEGYNYGTYGQNPPPVYPPYPLYSGESGSSSWAQQEESSSNEYGYGQSLPQIPPQIPPPDPYGWHISNYMQEYAGDISWDAYSSRFTYSGQDDDDDRRSMEPPRNSMWF